MHGRTCGGEPRQQTHPQLYSRMSTASFRGARHLGTACKRGWFSSGAPRPLRRSWVGAECIWRSGNSCQAASDAACAESAKKMRGQQSGKKCSVKLSGFRRPSVPTCYRQRIPPSLVSLTRGRALRMHRTDGARIGIDGQAGADGAPPPSSHSGVECAASGVPLCGKGGAKLTSAARVACAGAGTSSVASGE